MISPMVQSVWLVPCYALIGSVIATLWSPRLISRTGPRPAGYVNLVTTLIAFVHSFAALFEAWGNPPLTFSLTWFQAADLSINIDLKFSSITIAAMAVITGLNLLAQFYAIAYLEMDWGCGGRGELRLRSGGLARNFRYK